MASPLPTPLAAALGVVPAVLEQVRRLPGRAVRLPVYAVSGALSTVDTLRREYDDLAERGEQLVARLLGETRAVAEAGVEVLVEDVPDAAPFSTAHLDAGAAVEAAVSNVAPLVSRGQRAAQRAAGTVADTAASAADTVADTAAAAGDAVGQAAQQVAGAVEDTAEDTAQGISSAAHEAGAAVEQAADTLQTAAHAAAEQADVPAEVPDAEAPKGAPTPSAPSGTAQRVDSAASPSVVETVEQVVEQSRTSATPEHSELPLPDYDHMTLGSLRGRMRALSVDQLVAIRTYEKAHADRLPVVTMLDNRIAKLSTDPSAAPSGPVSTSPAPEQLATASGPSGGISPATTTAPKINPPSHGDPTNPAQPRS